MARRHETTDPALAAVTAGYADVGSHPLFRPMTSYLSSSRSRYDRTCPPDGAAIITANGHLSVHPTRRADAAQWTWTFAHLLCHLGFSHALPDGAAGDTYDHAAQCVSVNRFLTALKLGRPPSDLPAELPGSDERALAQQWRERGTVPQEYRDLGTGGSAGCIAALPRSTYAPRPPDFATLFAAGLSDAATAAVDVAGGARTSLRDARAVREPWELALSWFISAYPLLGALASGLTLVADAGLARAWDIRIAAVSAQAGEIYLNPLAQHTSEEWRFILAHEMLHAGLRHDTRLGGRDPHLFNVACDLVINGWLVAMAVGQMPDGSLYDAALVGMSAEEVYDRITTDLRVARKLRTLRGTQAHGAHAGEFGGGDLLGRGLPRSGSAEHVDLDAFYRAALSAGLDFHQVNGRGLLPAGLVEQIRALEHPPLSWDAQLARWFDEHVPAQHRSRSYARPSRRQSSTPDIPRPGWVWPDELSSRSTFGVVLDTSGSMPLALLGKALGAIASYAASRDVPAARLVCCDAAAYDLGYVPVEQIADRVQLKGRGGTVLQPGVDALERAKDFPAAGPMLIITDGDCDVLRIRREHAFLIPAHAQLPYTPRGPVFRIS